MQYWLQPSTPTIAICYMYRYYLVLILLYHHMWRAEGWVGKDMQILPKWADYAVGGRSTPLQSEVTHVTLLLMFLMLCHSIHNQNDNQSLNHHKGSTQIRNRVNFWPVTQVDPVAACSKYQILCRVIQTTVNSSKNNIHMTKY